MRPAYQQAHDRAWRPCSCPGAYGGGGASTVDFLIAVEELCAVDPGFPTSCS